MKIDTFTGKYYFLSNFYFCPIEIDGIKYPTVEHAFQAAKTYIVREKKDIAGQRTPAMAKGIGRKVMLRSDWEQVKVQIMTDLVRRKFTENKELRAKLIATGNAELAEGNLWKDTFWGVDLRTGIGQNCLGRILMKVRGELAESRVEDSDL